MTTTTRPYVCWFADGAWLGFLAEFPDYPTRGETRADLEAQLRAMYADLMPGEIPNVERRLVAEIQVADIPGALDRAIAEAAKDADWDAWDAQIEADTSAGRTGALDALADKARRDHEAGRSTPL